jgi:fructose transport system substrate-binding protein
VSAFREPGAIAAVCAVLAACVAAFGVAACGGDDSSGGSSQGSSGAFKTSGSASGEKIKVGLITKTETNPFFVKMKEGASSAAQGLGADLQSFAGKKDGDNETQVAAVENLISSGAKGFMITANDSKAIVPSLDKARQAGLLVWRWTRRWSRRTRRTRHLRPTTSSRAR